MHAVSLHNPPKYQTMNTDVVNQYVSVKFLRTFREISEFSLKFHRLNRFLRYWVPTHPYDFDAQMLAIANRMLSMSVNKNDKHSSTRFGSLLSLELARAPMRKPVVSPRLFPKNSLVEYQPKEIAKELTRASSERWLTKNLVCCIKMYLFSVFVLRRSRKCEFSCFAAKPHVQMSKIHSL